MCEFVALLRLCTVLIAPRTQQPVAHTACVSCCAVLCCTVLVKWKSVGLSILLEREREQQNALIAASGGVPIKSSSADDLERLLVPFDA